jgi:serine protease AprX
MVGTLSRNVLPARLLAALCALLVATIASTSIAAAPTVPSGMTSVIVRGEAGALVQLEHSTALAGGTVVRELGLIDAFSAKIPTAKLAAISALPGVIAVSPDSAVSLHSDYNPGADPYSMASTAAAIGASTAWAAGITGAGVDVALVDSGVTPVQGLAGEGKVVNGPDLSVDSQNPSVRYLDGFGHGTFMAGLIGGKDPGADPSHPGGSYLGVAPDARIVNVKVGSGGGAVDVSQVIAGIDWVVQHRHDNGLNIRVLNLSIGTNSNQSYQLDPLAYAAEVAWRSGIVVVAAAGNSGASNGHLDDPASDPYVLAIGASGSTGGGLLGGLLGNLLVAAFSSLGNGTRNPDLVAPGSHLQGLRVPGSYIDQNFHSAAFGDRFFRGSGTSEAAALTSGAVALLLQKRPWLQPGQVKAILTQTAAPLPLVPVKAQGAGVLRLAAGVSDRVSVPDGGQGFGQSSGAGSLEGARGDKHVSVNGVPLTGEEDIFGHGFSGSDHATQSASGEGWSSEGGWNGTTWSGTTWSGTTWSGTTWSGTTWSGTTWSGTTWSGTTWSGTTWSGTTWSGDIWSNYSWS